MRRLRYLRTLLILQTTLSIRTLRVPWRAVHLTAASVLLGAIHLLRLRVLSGLPASRLVSNGRQLWAVSHMRHHVLLTILLLARWLLRLILALPGRFLALALVFLLARVVLLFLLRFPFFANLFELYQHSQHIRRAAWVQSVTLVVRDPARAT